MTDVGEGRLRRVERPTSDLAAVRGPAAILDPVRLAAVRATGLLDSPAVESLDHLTRLAAMLLEAPLAFLTVVDDERSYWASRVGVVEDQRQNTVEESFCQYVVADAAPLIVDDTALNLRTRDNPSVLGMGVRAWAGYPVLDSAGNALGSFCVVDTVPRHWSAEQTEVLRVLSETAAAHLEVLAQVEAQRDARERAQQAFAASDGLARMAAVALELGSVQTLEDLGRVIIDHGLPAIGADGGAIAVRDDREGVVRLVLGRGVGKQVQETYGVVPLSSPLPAAVTARTGEQVLLPTRESGLAFTPQMAAVYEDTGRHGWAICPMLAGDELLGSVAASWVREHHLSQQEVELLQGFAALCAQTLDKLQRQQEQRRATTAVREMSETLQRSLLTQPSLAAHLSLAVRYEPAAQEAQIGGDWYDAFVTTGGLLTVAIGDVSGHDRMAAAAMGQVRNLLRGMAFDSRDSPAVLLSRLDAGLRGLELETLATAVLAQVSQSPAQRNRGVHALRWSNAGHLPPLLRRPDGGVQVLTSTPDLMLGVAPGTDRAERFAELVDGSTLLLYTDGLVERRDTVLDEGIGRLERLFATVGGAHPGAVCDAVLEQMRDGHREDDCAVLVLRLEAG